MAKKLGALSIIVLVGAIFTLMISVTMLVETKSDLCTKNQGFKSFAVGTFSAVLVIVIGLCLATPPLLGVEGNELGALYLVLLMLATSVAVCSIGLRLTSCDRSETDKKAGTVLGGVLTAVSVVTIAYISYAFREQLKSPASQ